MQTTMFSLMAILNHTQRRIELKMGFSIPSNTIWVDGLLTLVDFSCFQSDSAAKIANVLGFMQAL